MGPVPFFADNETGSEKHPTLYSHCQEGSGALGWLSQRQDWALCGWELEMSKEKDSGQGKWPPGLQRRWDPNMEAGAGW